MGKKEAEHQSMRVNHMKSTGLGNSKCVHVTSMEVKDNKQEMER